MVILVATVALAATIRVGPGEDYETLAEASDVVVDGDVIEVAAGTWSQQLDLRADVTLVAVDGPELTTLTGGYNEAMIRVYADVVLDGFTITSEYERHCIRVWEGSLVVRGSVVERCQPVDGLGGGLRSDPGTAVRIEDSTFRDNISNNPEKSHIAAHLYSRSELLEVYDSHFENGIVYDDESPTLIGDGAAIYAINGVVRVERSTFTANVAGDDAAGIFLVGSPTDGGVGYTFHTEGVSSFTLLDSVFVGNSAADRGGVIFLQEMPGAEIAGNVFLGNSAGNRGGVLYADAATGLINIHHNVFAGNTAADDGGAVYLLDSDAAFLHNHFVGNEAGDAAGAIGVQQGDITLFGNLFARNEGGEAVWPNNATVSALDYNLWFDTGAPIAGVSIGVNDVEGDPMFVALSDDGDWTNDDLRLGAGSAAIDAGDPTLTDPDGTRADIGAYGGEAPAGTTGETTTPVDPTDPTAPAETPPTVPAPTDPGTIPEAPEPDPDQVDLNVTAAAGCACDGTRGMLGGAPFWVAGLMLARRRSTARP